MNAKTHDVIAFAALISAAVVYEPKQLGGLAIVTAIVANIVGALIPDMDQAGNRLWDLLPAGNTVGKILRRIFYKHRTLTHSFLGLFLIYRFLEWLLPKLLNPEFIDPNIILWSMMIGYISHIIADAFTKEGVPLLFPISVNFGFPPFETLRITTGKWIENFVVFPMVILYIILIVFTFQYELIQIFG